jgi:hypothetical protein
LDLWFVIPQAYPIRHRLASATACDELGRRCVSTAERVGCPAVPTGVLAANLMSSRADGGQRDRHRERSPHRHRGHDRGEPVRRIHHGWVPVPAIHNPERPRADGSAGPDLNINSGGGPVRTLTSPVHTSRSNGSPAKRCPGRQPREAIVNEPVLTRRGQTWCGPGRTCGVIRCASGRGIRSLATGRRGTGVRSRRSERPPDRPATIGCRCGRPVCHAATARGRAAPRWPHLER